MTVLVQQLKKYVCTSKWPFWYKNRNTCKWPFWYKNRNTASCKTPKLFFQPVHVTFPDKNDIRFLVPPYLFYTIAKKKFLLRNVLQYSLHKGQGVVKLSWWLFLKFDWWCCKQSIVLVPKHAQRRISLLAGALHKARKYTRTYQATHIRNDDDNAATCA